MESGPDTMEVDGDNVQQANGLMPPPSSVPFIHKAAESPSLKRKEIVENVVKLKYRAGDVICQSERPLAVAFEPECINKYCGWCFVPLQEDVKWPCHVEKVNSCASLTVPVPKSAKSLFPCPGPCAGAGAWYCSAECQSKDWDECHDLECRLYGKYRIACEPPDVVLDLSKSLADKMHSVLNSSSVRLALNLYVRCLKHPELINLPVWRGNEGRRRSLRDFAAHVDQARDSGHVKWNFLRASSEIVFAALQDEGLINAALGFDDKLLEFLTCLSSINCVAISNAFTFGVLGIAVYGDESIFNHSCRPNATWHFEGPRSIVRAVQPILEGDDITLVYRGANIDSNIRRVQLKDHYFFDCSCVRCVSHPRARRPLDLDQRGSILTKIVCADFGEVRQKRGGRLLQPIQDVLKQLYTVARRLMGEVVDDEGCCSASLQLFGDVLTRAAIIRYAIAAFTEYTQLCEELYFPNEGNTEDLERLFAAVQLANGQDEQLSMGDEKRRRLDRRQMLAMIRQNYVGNLDLDMCVAMGGMAVTALTAHRVACAVEMKMQPMQILAAMQEQDDCDKLTKQEIDGMLRLVKYCSKFIDVKCGSNSLESICYKRTFVEPVENLSSLSISSIIQY